MSTTQTPDPLLKQRPKDAWYTRLPLLIQRVVVLLLLYLFGPMIFYAKGLQKNAAGPSWQAEKRWAHINGSVFPWLLVYIPILFFHTALGSFWIAIFTTLALWVHLPFLAWFGGTMLFPPVPSSILLRWFLTFPLAGLLALCMEAVEPRTTWHSKRILTQEEQQELDVLAAAEEKKRLAQENRKLKAAQQAQTAPSPADPVTDTATPTSPKKRPPRSPARAKKEVQPLLPPATSLWGQIDWSSVPHDHPLKQAVREEAARLEDQRREQERSRWLAQQRAAQHTGGPSTVDASIINSTLAQSVPSSPPPTPTPAPAPPAEESEYNWDEGEGSIQEERETK